MAEELKLDDMSNTEFILEQVDDIRDYLDGKISLDEIPINIELPSGEKNKPCKRCNTRFTAKLQYV